MNDEHFDEYLSFQMSYIHDLPLLRKLRIFSVQAWYILVPITASDEVPITSSDKVPITSSDEMPMS